MPRGFRVSEPSSSVVALGIPSASILKAFDDASVTLAAV